MKEIKNMVLAMASMQDAYNLKVHAEWQQQGYAYYRAIWVECAELLDHYGWKWWKHQVPDMEQSKLEVIDIWHFGLSDLIRAGAVSSSHVSEDVLQSIHSGISGQAGDLRSAIESHAIATLSAKAFDIDTFFAMMCALPLSFEDLYSGYIGKNVLNKFRQDNGYKTGEYVKEWGGVEDNAHLVEISATMNLHADDYSETLYTALEQRYKKLTA